MWQISRNNSLHYITSHWIARQQHFYFFSERKQVYIVAVVGKVCRLRLPCVRGWWCLGADVWRRCIQGLIAVGGVGKVFETCAAEGRLQLAE